MNQAENNNDKPWEFAGWGRAERLTRLGDSKLPLTRLDQPDKHLLGSWRATAICGNDISSSVLYVSALCAAQAGALAPIVLLIVAVRGTFTPQIIEAISRRFKIPKNYMFIGTPGDHFPHRIEALGGVRLIL